MPNTARNHKQSLQALCSICLMKRADRQITEGQKLAAYKICQGFVVSDLMPSGICNSCRVFLGNPESKNSPKPPQRDYQSLLNELQSLPPLTRTNPVCLCSVCKKLRVSPGFTSQDKTTAGSASPKPLKRGRPRLKSPPRPITVCSTCMGEISRGIPHPYNKSTRRQNVDNMLSPKIKEQITSDTVKEKLNTSGLEVIFIYM